MNQMSNKNNTIQEMEELKKRKKEIEEKLKESDEAKLLKQIEQEEWKLRDTIRKFSTYDITSIGNILAKLMEEFEGIPYYCRQQQFFGNDFYVTPVENKYSFGPIYPSYNLNPITQQEFYDFSPYKDKDAMALDWFFCGKDEKMKCYLKSSAVIPKSNNKGKNVRKNIPYIQIFIDYLYEKRANQELYEISNEKLEEILHEFLEMSQDLQQQRKEEIKDLLEERLAQKKREEYEKSCLIDRKLIFNLLTFIINHYEENMSAIQETEEVRSGSSQWSVLTGYHKLTIQCDNKKVCFKTEVDSDGCYPDEDYCGALYVNLNKNTNVCFFDIKRTLLPVLKNSDYAIQFMNRIEEMYMEKQNITSEDIHPLLVNITNENKAKKKSL